MKLSYVIGVCNEHLELSNLLIFLKEVIDKNHEVVVVVDSNKVTKQVEEVLENHIDWVKRFDKPFEFDFSKHKNFFANVTKGEYIFNLDADEIPQEFLINMIENIVNKPDAPDLIAVPRINICPGYTQRFLKENKFSCNELGWINWPDYQGRVYKRHLKWSGKVHEKIQGAKKSIGLQADPKLALWHIKSTTKQNKQNVSYSTLM